MRWLIIFIGLALAAMTGPAIAFGSCRDEGYLPRFDARLPSSLPVECRELLRVNIETGSLRVPMRLISYQATPSLDEDPARTHLRRLAAKTGAAMELLGDLDLAQVTILLTDATAPATSADGSSPAHAWASGWRADDECTIAFFKQAGEITEEYFLISLSHEIFHCVQGKTWREKTALYPIGAWWIEGSAVYFSHLVVPDTEQLDFLANAFDASSPSTALTDMNYDASIFFLWLHAKVGPRTGVRRLIDAMPASGGGDQIGALRSVVGLDQWTQFAEDYLDARIKQPGGRSVPTTARFPSVKVFTGPATESIETRPYVVGRARLVFREGKSYDLKTTVTDGGRVRMQPFDADWTDPLTEILACNEDQSFNIALTAVEADATADFIVTDAEDLERASCCLVGDWTPTDASLGGFARASMSGGAAPVAGAGGAMDCAHTGGGWTLRFSADGTGGVLYKSYANLCTITAPDGNRMAQTTVADGNHEFQWRVSDRGIGSWTPTENSLRRHIILKAGPRTVVDRTFNDPGPSVDRGGFAYQCTDTTLSVRGIYSLNQFQEEHTRIDPPSP